MTQHQPAIAPPSQPAKLSKTTIIVLSIVGSILALCFCCCGGLMLIGLTMPEGGVRTGQNMEQYAADYISNRGILEPGETIVLYYDETADMDSTQCVILTDQRLIYHSLGGDTVMQADQVIEVTQDDVFLGTMITVKDTADQYIWFEVFVGEHEPMFINALEDLVEQNLIAIEQATGSADDATVESSD